MVEVVRLARRFHCQTANTRFNFLGLPVGDNMKKKVAWTQVDQRLLKKDELLEVSYSVHSWPAYTGTFNLK